MQIDFMKLLKFCQAKKGLKVYDEFEAFLVNVFDNPNSAIEISIPEDILEEFMKEG